MLAAPEHLDTRYDLLHRLQQARRVSDESFNIVKPESLYKRPIAERHRIIFYLGHLEAFDWNLLRGRVLDENAFQPEFDRLFAFGIDPVDGGLPQDQPSDWPSVAEVQHYIARIREILDTALPRIITDLQPTREFPAGVLLNVAIEHRLMHVETLAYMFHQLPLASKIPQAQGPEPLLRRVEAAMIEIPDGEITLGLHRGDGKFGWDNEYEAHTKYVPTFLLDKYKVTNGQFLRFMQAGGYEERSFWGDDDWDWKARQNISHPVFWRKSRDQWLYQTMFAEIPLPADWPVYVSHAEASAYARWAGKALPSEAQWQRAAHTSPQGAGGRTRATGVLGNFDRRRWNPIPVGSFPLNGFGLADMQGNGWEWTSSIFGPFPGFERFEFYPGYSANFFDGKHYVMKGGSARTAACMMRPSFRNWFQPHYQYVYAGFRCVSG